MYVHEDVTYLFRLKKEIDDSTMKGVRNIFKLKKNGWHHN